MNKEKSEILTQLLSVRATDPRSYWASVGMALISMFGMVAAFGTAPSTFDRAVSQRVIVDQLAPEIQIAESRNEQFFVREELIQRGDNVSALLARLGVQDDAAFRFIREDALGQTIFRQLRPGKSVSVEISSIGELQSLVFPLNGSDQALFIDRLDDSFRVSQRTLDLETHVQMKSGEVRHSLFGATDDAGIPDSIALQLADIFGSDIDFHSDLRRGDRFSVVYETLSHLGKPVRTGRILAAEFVNEGKAHRAFWYEPAPGQGGYYSADGNSLRKAFLRSPLEFSRVSSGFTNARFHPILQKWRAHKGVDYAASTGTRIRATSDGIVDFVGNQGGYGRVVVLRHQGRYTTLYGHLSGFAAGLRKGSRISQGEIIGYVGSSGWATGPHLHYELRINDVHQNPLSVALPTTPHLSTQQLTAFTSKIEPAINRLALMKDSHLALLD